MNYIGALAIEGKTFDYKTNERLHKALEFKLFEDQKDTIKLYYSGLSTKLLDSNEVKIGNWANALKGGKIDVEILAYFDKNEFKDNFANTHRPDVYRFVQYNFGIGMPF